LCQRWGFYPRVSQAARRAFHTGYQKARSRGHENQADRDIRQRSEVHVRFNELSRARQRPWIGLTLEFLPTAEFRALSGLLGLRGKLRGLEFFPFLEPLFDPFELPFVLL
jgi:hypothetical protein